jgi:hypothetical protein
VADPSLDDPLTMVWQVSLADFYTPETQLVSLSGVAMLTSPVHGVLTLGAGPPDLRSDAGRWPASLRIIGTSLSGQIMVMDDSGMVYRYRPGQMPVPAWNSTYHPDDIEGVVGLPGGRLLVERFDDSWAETEMIDEATGRVAWRSPVLLVPVMPVGDQLIGSGFGDASRDLVSLDVQTGQERWRRRGAFVSSPNVITVVDGVLWATDRSSDDLLGFSVDSGRPVATIVLPRPTWQTGVLDQAGYLHLGDEHGWIVLDLAQPRVAGDIRFEPSGIGKVYAGQTVRSADGRLVLADAQGQIFVVHPARPTRPELVATFPKKKAMEIGAGRLIVLSRDGTLTALGAPS